MSDKQNWVSSSELAAFLRLHRDNDVRVSIAGFNVPIIDAHYDRTADMVIIEVDTEDLEYELACDEIRERGEE